MSVRNFGIVSLPAFAFAALAISSTLAPGSARAAIQVLAQGKTTEGGDGGIYYGALLEGPGGVLYAVPTEGANSGHGAVIELKPPAAGKTTWTQTVLHKFAGTPTDGFNSEASVIADKAGDLYGTTTTGGANNQGVVFKLTKPAPGKTAWVESILYNFGVTVRDASQSRAPLVFDTKGNLYGTTTYGGGSTRCGETGCGTVFKLAPPAAGKTKWTETILHRFGATAVDGQLPELGKLVIDTKGNLYGTAGNGGAHNAGMAFKLTAPAAGKTVWTETALVHFNNYGGATGGLVMDKAGTLYGALSGGTNGNGSIFRLTPPAAGRKVWVQTILYDFQTFNDCNHPDDSLILDKNGNLFGTAHDVGATPVSGTVAGCLFSLRKSGTKYVEKILTSFTAPQNGSPRQGAFPEASLIADANGNLYGTTTSGGAFSAGTIFKLTGSGFVP